MKSYLSFVLLSLVLACSSPTGNQTASSDEARPWVFWYWMKGGVTKAGITADLEAMKEAGLGGAYLMPIQGPDEGNLYVDPPVVQLTPEWWDMIQFSMAEAKRLGLEIGMHDSDGFALAGGPWITPELSMQKIVWSERILSAGTFFDTLRKPDHKKNYYKDLGVYAFKLKEKYQSSDMNTPTVRTSLKENADFLISGEEQDQFRCTEDCWFEYEFNEPFTCQSIEIITKGNNYQSHRLQIEASPDGKSYSSVYKMNPPRHGWQDTDANVTHAIPKTTARFFRFKWVKEGTEPGAEDLDAAKWSATLKIAGLKMTSIPKIHQFEGKTGEVWRISPRTTNEQLDPNEYFNLDHMVDLSEKLDSMGRLKWEVPQGQWLVLRMGHTSTGHTNYTGGGALGLECDKFNPDAINLQFDEWYGKIAKKISPEYQDILTKFHIDSWECGSQNWSPVFKTEFKKRRGYDPMKYLPAMAGIPMGDPKIAEGFLYDVRQTIAELTIDNFYGIMAHRAHELGVEFSAENVSPTMLSDGMRHFGEVDLPMGEFWLESPTHDKPNDMLDAISGAHIYGKKIIQAEGFTQLRQEWDEYPAMLKSLQDRNYAMGINKLFYHVYAHNPWVDKQPGVTLGPIGLFFQRDQTWWKPGKEWVNYAIRCQELLQQGMPVADVAVFTGEGLPRRSILPDRLVPTLPGLFGEEVVAQEKTRLKNEGQPQREMPAGVTHSANMADPENWLNPLNGYKYDSFNKDALLRLSSVKAGKLSLSSGPEYSILVLPKARKMNPNPEYMSVEVAEKLLQLIEAGLTVLTSEPPVTAPGLQNDTEKIQLISDKIWKGEFKEELFEGDTYLVKSIGKGKVIKTPYELSSFEPLGYSNDLNIKEKGQPAKNVAWTHRRNNEKEIYFISNQQDTPRIIALDFNQKGKIPTLYDAVYDQKYDARSWSTEANRTILSVKLEASGSIFVIFETVTSENSRNDGPNWDSYEVNSTISEPWKVTFNDSLNGPKRPQLFKQLISFKDNENDSIKYYAGSATYTTSFDFKDETDQTYLDLGAVANIAEVEVNGIPCGITWTPPYRLDITNAIQKGENEVKITVTNTWRNRLIGDQNLPENERVTYTTAPYRLEGKPLVDGGLLGPVRLLKKK